jgi:succinyl-CoA synthetase beta subunit
MRIHEYHAKKILSDFKVPIPEGEVANTPDEAKRIAKRIGKRVVVKAQIHAGGRGKGGGVKIAKSPEDAYRIANEIIGMNLVTPQVPDGKKVRKVLVEEAFDVDKELYLGVVVDRSRGEEQPVIMGSEVGGVEIEEVVRNKPSRIIKVSANPLASFTSFQGRKIAYGLRLDKSLIRETVDIIRSLYDIFMSKDATLAEINPLALTHDGKFVALDAKMDFDDDAVYRHPDIKALYDPDEEEPLEGEASGLGISYVKLGGDIGCMVNGAGLAMATMDLIKLAGGEPANFLDVGGGASVEQIENAFRILISDENVKSILINIFGGILRCDRVAKGLIEAASALRLDMPMVVRLQGTNVEEGRSLLEGSRLRFEIASSLSDAAQKAVALATEGESERSFETRSKEGG